MRNNYVKYFGLMLAMALMSSTFLSCSGPKTDDASDTTAITNRPQNYDQLIAIIKLKQPALLTTASRDINGVTVVDDDLKAAIEAEQTAFVQELNDMSDEIRVLYRYKMVLNAVAVVAPRELEEKFRKLTSTSYVERETPFQRLAPVEIQDATAAGQGDFDATSAGWIGAYKAHADLGINGAGITVGVIDTGIDYTHKMFGGPGTTDAFQANNPDFVEDGSFPTDKVVGGIDLVGKEYDASSPQFAKHLPKEDADPLDDGSHGTHVAGSVAGIGDGVKTYDGVAPEAKLHAIKVFGANGSTGDAVIIAALEYSADPNRDGDPADQLDVINLSLGSGYGTPHLLYSEAMKNLVNGGTLSVASAGNSGHTSYIVGAPGTTAEAISVAASIDNMSHNWKFDASRFTLPNQDTILVEAIEAAFAKPITEVGDLNGKLVFIGIADQPLDNDTAAKLAGNVALIDRGAVAFCTKAEHAKAAGAIGFVVANNVDGDAFTMGGDCEFDIPGIMITKTLGDNLKGQMDAGDVNILFGSGDKIEKPELIDTLTSFSSQGPRSIDALIKPEVAAPGYNIVSAKSGSGDEGVKFNGTSMAAPHVAGMAALVKQRYGNLDNKVLKSIIVNSALSINDAEGQVYPVSQQGAGRVQVYKALTATVAVTPSTLSVGAVLVEQKKAVRKSFKVNNLSSEDLTLTVEVNTDDGLTVELPSSIEVKAGEEIQLRPKVILQPTFTDDAAVEFDGFVRIKNGDAIVAQIPVLAIARKSARIKGKKLRVQATSNADAEGAIATVTLKNNGKTSGAALPFNLIARDKRKQGYRQNKFRNGICDLEAAGYRIVTKDIEGEAVQMVEFGVKLFNPVTTWHICEVSIQVDADGDGKADQELLGTYAQTLTDNRAHNNLFLSILTDAEQMRSIRATYEANWPDQDTQDYSSAIVDSQEYRFFAHSTVAVVAARLDQLATTPEGDLKVKIAVLADSSTPEADDFLAKQEKKWQTLRTTADGMGFIDLPAELTIEAGANQSVELTKGGGKHQLLLLLPHNASNFSTFRKDAQAQVLRPRFGF